MIFPAVTLKRVCFVMCFSNRGLYSSSHIPRLADMFLAARHCKTGFGLSANPLPSNNSRQVVQTHVPV